MPAVVPPAAAASLHGPLTGQSVELAPSAPAAAVSGGVLGGDTADARTYFEPVPYEPAAETCAFSLDVLCSDDTEWLNRDVFGTEYRFDPSDDAQGAPSDGDLGLTISNGLSGGALDKNPSLTAAHPHRAVPLGVLTAD